MTVYRKQPPSCKVIGKRVRFIATLSARHVRQSGHVQLVFLWRGNFMSPEQQFDFHALLVETLQFEPPTEAVAIQHAKVFGT
jgi:hypothetical protein